MTTRRSLLLGLGAIIAAPAIVRASSLMPVRLPLILRSPIYLDFCRDFGGVGDGVTDNSAAWARAMAWSEQFFVKFGTPGKDATLFVPRGIYRAEAWPPLLPPFVRTVGDGVAMMWVAGETT